MDWYCGKRDRQFCRGIPGVGNGLHSVFGGLRVLALGGCQDPEC